MPDLHPAVIALGPLLGTWTGRGTGEYATIEPFGYLEEVTFDHSGKPFLSYHQRTRSTDGQPMHSECGYLRVPQPGRIELALAQPTGVTEVDEGTLTAGAELVIELHSTTIGLSSSAKSIAAVHRSIRVRGDELSYRLGMSAVGRPMNHHLAATLHRAR